MSFTAFDKRYLAITLYGPNRDDPDFYRNHVFNINNYPAHDFALWAGDWNLVLDKKKTQKITRENITKKLRVV